MTVSSEGLSDDSLNQSLFSDDNVLPTLSTSLDKEILQLSPNDKGDSSVSHSRSVSWGSPIPKVTVTKYTNPNWMDQMRREFKDLIISKCSPDTIRAYENDVEIDDIRVKKKVRCEIIDSVMDHVLTIYGGLDQVPKLSVMREVPKLLGFKYPNMFQVTGNEGNHASF